MWFVNETNMVREAMDASPVNRFFAVITDNACSIPEDVDFAVIRTTYHFVTSSTETNRWNSRVSLSCDRPMAECAVEPEAFHCLTVSGNMFQLLRRRVNRVREINGLVKGLLKTQHRYRLSEPSCYYKCSNSTDNSQHAKPSRS